MADPRDDRLPSATALGLGMALGATNDVRRGAPGAAGLSPSTRAIVCQQCGTEVAPTLLACPACHGLVHSAELKELAARAESAERAGDLAAALEAWRTACALLPAESRQYAVVAGHVDRIARMPAATRPPGAGAPQAPTAPHADGGAGAAKKGGLIATLGLLLLKFKFAIVFLLTKAKFLVLGLTKASTLFSMLAFLGVYWALWGWKFALGFVVSLYIHEMGHVYELRKRGIPASAPMFIPGLGAFVRLRTLHLTPVEDARIGLAGPLWGLGAALAAYGIHLATDVSYWLAIAHVGAWLNLFNLVPFWQLDGARGFHSLTRQQRAMAAGVIGLTWFLSGDGLLAILLAVAVWRCFEKGITAKPDWTAFAQYAGLVLALGLLVKLRVPGLP